MGKLIDLEDLVLLRERWRREGKKVVFTNGCFDILHRGHVELLKAAKALGDILIVGLNDDDSVRRLKGPQRPFYPLEDRAAMLAAFEAVDYVCPFSEDTPLKMISRLLPDVLVKGGDYRPEEVVGREVVEGAGGEVVIVPLWRGRSTSEVIEKIVERFGRDGR
ncbi:MAG: D-glycero-beta-D-manno-heptose 1-phosphate adenylyltransferase [Candidatus Latescibacterota bacterium]|nr:MAG: D-glycero-beta-D-manno-heptose 1-phosphate adenylyltransferase [Candidatus Latescibacterota bacterium]RKY72279.1 MAG: D-glycero-beta-D-manno-heptose 1-phosphate adenylyltransferase [Candidatus Latescibacterota bacterium]